MAEFTHDWFGRYAAYWQELFASRGWRPDTPRTIVEIGSYEGRSALWMLENLLQHPQSRLHCVDIFHDLRFIAAGNRADFIYVDGSHRAAEVLEDLVLAFHATRPGGIIICDDYLKVGQGGDLTLGSPKLAVDAFTTIYRDRLDIPRGQPLYQLAMIKTADRTGDDPGARGG